MLRLPDVETDRPKCLIVPVNCVNVMGAGLAKVAADYNPRIKWAYTNIRNKQPGNVYFANVNDKIFSSVGLATTKDHWRQPSRLSWIDACLIDIRQRLGNTDEFMFIPKLGCGLGGLNFKDVKEAIDMELYFHKNRYVII